MVDLNWTMICLANMNERLIIFLKNRIAYRSDCCNGCFLLLVSDVLGITFSVPEGRGGKLVVFSLSLFTFSKNWNKNHKF